MLTMNRGVNLRVCPVCGKQATTFINGLCEECYRQANPLLKIPGPVEVVMCRLCGAYRVKGKWNQPREGDPLAQALETALYNYVESGALVRELRIERIAGNSALAVAYGSTERGLEDYEERYEFTYRVRWSLCDACINAKSKKEVARIQVRAKGRSLTLDEVKELKRVVDKVLSSIQRGHIDLIDVVESKGGIDFLFSSLSTAKTVLKGIEREFPVTILETRKNAGMDSRGKPRAKITYRAMFPEFRVGDIMSYHGKEYYVIGLSNKLVKALSLEKMEKENLAVSRSLIEKSRVICKREEGEAVLVSSVGREEVQVVSLVNSRVYSLFFTGRNPWVKENSHAILFRVSNRLLLVPLF